MEEKGILIVVSGFSGAGKGSVMRELLRRYPEVYALSVSATTRLPRAGETDGVEYFFRTKEQFEEMIRQNELAEYAQYVGHYYGTPREYVEKKLAEGKNVILEIEIQGALQVRKCFPDAVLLFLSPPSAVELKNRLSGRGTETADVVRARLERAGEEAHGIGSYDYFVVNDRLSDCVEEVHAIVRSERHRVFRCLEMIEKIKGELAGFGKEHKL